MNHLGYVVDASVAFKWFLKEGEEPEVERATRLIGTLQIQTTSLCVYELGNTLSRFAGDDPDLVAAALERVRMICGDPIALEPGDHLYCATLAQKHSITFYDASYVAVAERLGRKVISADRDLLEPGLAVSLAEAVEAGD